MAHRTSLSVLIVDDDAAFRRLLRQLIEGAGGQVVGEAADGAEGIALAAALEPDLITMDLEMPRIDGVAATATLCENGCPPIVIVSGSHSNDQVGNALLAGARWHVAKLEVADQLPELLAAFANGDAANS